MFAGYAATLIGLYICVKFWLCREIDLKWKAILTIIAATFRFVTVAVLAALGTFLPVMIMYFILRWHGRNIR